MKILIDLNLSPAFPLLYQTPERKPEGEKEKKGQSVDLLRAEDGFAT